MTQRAHLDVSKSPKPTHSVASPNNNRKRKSQGGSDKSSSTKVKVEQNETSTHHEEENEAQVGLDSFFYYNNTKKEFHANVAASLRTHKSDLAYLTTSKLHLKLFENPLKMHIKDEVTLKNLFEAAYAITTDLQKVKPSSALLKELQLVLRNLIQPVLIERWENDLLQSTVLRKTLADRTRAMETFRENADRLSEEKAKIEKERTQMVDLNETLTGLNKTLTIEKKTLEEKNEELQKLNNTLQDEVNSSLAFSRSHTLFNDKGEKQKKDISCLVSKGRASIIDQLVTVHKHYGADSNHSKAAKLIIIDLIKDAFSAEHETMNAIFDKHQEISPEVHRKFKKLLPSGEIWPTNINFHNNIKAAAQLFDRGDYLGFQDQAAVEYFRKLHESVKNTGTAQPPKIDNKTTPRK